jgi:DNA-binding LacI/PurR family transcriptional regulator
VRRRLQRLHEWHHHDLHHLVQAKGRKLIALGHREICRHTLRHRAHAEAQALQRRLHAFRNRYRHELLRVRDALVSR